MALDMQSVYVLASGGARALEQLDEVTSNIANINTNGFKKILVKEMSQRLDENGADANHLFVFPRFERSIIDTSQGALKETKNPFDIAIDGKGYFVIQKGETTYLTRDGHLFLNSEGYLIDNNGNYVLDTQDKPIQLSSNEDITVTPAGEIYQKNEPIAKLKIVDFSDIEAVGKGYYKQKGEEQKPRFQIKQGFLESSNVNVIEQMTEMINAQRRFEMYNNLIKSIDQINQKTNDIGKA